MTECTKCGLSKDASEFYSSDIYWCKTCRSEYSRARNNSSQIRRDLENGNRICNGCNGEKTLDDFPRDKKCKGGRGRTCKDCTYRKRDKARPKIRKQQAEWYKKNRDRILKTREKYYEENKEEIKAYARKYHKDNPEVSRAAFHKRRAKIKSNGRNDLTAEQISWMFENFPKCTYCGCEGDLTIDHVIPISKGGENTLDNVVPACSPCNNKKRAKLLGTTDITFFIACEKCFEVRTDRILTNQEWEDIHALH